MSIRWTIQDRSTGQSVTVAQPRTMRERDGLKTYIKQVSVLGMRGKALAGLV